MPDDLLIVAIQEHERHVYADQFTCCCGYRPPLSMDWDRHVLAAVLGVVLPAHRAQVGRGIFDACLAQRDHLNRTGRERGRDWSGREEGLEEAADIARKHSKEKADA